MEPYLYTKHSDHQVWPLVRTWIPIPTCRSCTLSCGRRSGSHSLACLSQSALPDNNLPGLSVSRVYMLTDQIIIHRRANRTRGGLEIACTPYFYHLWRRSVTLMPVREGNSSPWVCPEIIIVVVQVYEITYALASVFHLSVRDRRKNRRWAQAHVCRCIICKILMCWSSVFKSTDS